jgi:hypothetical protein
LLRLAKAVNDPAFTAELITKAADLEEKALGAGDPHQPPITPAMLDEPPR